jgi:hypothetical protein
MIYGVHSAPPSLYYNLRVGSTFGFLGWNFQATNIKAFTPKLADAGLVPGYSANRVPNASFEDSSINFAGTGTFVADPGKQGSQVWRSATSSVDQVFALPVEPGQSYAFSFWYFKSVGGDTEVEYGLTAPTFRGAQGSNSLAPGGIGNWVEASGTFTPTAGQTNFYIAAFANVGYVQFDSMFLAQVPEPTAAAAMLGIGCLVFGSRKRRCLARSLRRKQR